METAETDAIRLERESPSHTDDEAWRARMLRADVDALSADAGELQSLVRQLTAVLGQVGASRHGAVFMLAARLQALNAVLGGVVLLPYGFERRAPVTVISGQIQSAILALGGTVDPTGLLRSYPGADPALSQQIVRLENALASVLARLQSLLSRLG